MNVGKALLLAVIIAAVGLVVMPSTVSLFHGQHIWYNISGKHYLPCSKCHYDVFCELSLSAFHKDLSEQFGNYTAYTNGTVVITAPSSYKVDSGDCYACHRANASITYANVGSTYTQYTPGHQAHAASVVACMLCHQFDAANTTGKTKYYVSTVPGFFAGGFENMTKLTGSPYRWVAPGVTDAGRWAAHNGFVMGAIKDKTMVDANEACIACHTETPVNITWHHAEFLNFTAKWNMTTWAKTNNATHYYTSNYTAGGNYTVYVLGNATGYGAVKLTNGSYFYAGASGAQSSLPKGFYPGYPW